MADDRRDRRVRVALRDALNGDAERVDPAVRRALTVLAVNGDDAEDRMARLEQRFDSLERKINSATATIVIAFATGASGVIWAIIA